MTGQSDGNGCSAACSVKPADPDPHLCKRTYAYVVFRVCIEDGFLM
jgi:hypothetical protein